MVVQTSPYMAGLLDLNVVVPNWATFPPLACVRAVVLFCKFIIFVAFNEFWSGKCHVQKIALMNCQIVHCVVCY